MVYGLDGEADTASIMAYPVLKDGTEKVIGNKI